MGEANKVLRNMVQQTNESLLYSKHPYSGKIFIPYFHVKSQRGNAGFLKKSEPTNISSVE